MIKMEVVPLKADGKEITEQDDIFVDNPNSLVSGDRDCIKLMKNRFNGGFPFLLGWQKT